MAHHRLVTLVGATGAQGGAVVRSLRETGKYKIHGLTRNSTSEKAQKLKQLMTLKNAFKDSWTIFALTDFWVQPDQPEVEMQQGLRLW